jgi:protein-disulfide isomerase
MGSSYDAGATKYVYPDPGQKGDGHKWLPALGAEGAPVVVIEFSDIFCGHCRMYNLNSLEGILNDYVAKGKVRYVDHYFGFDQAVQAGVAEAEMCAAEQGRYFEFKHALFQTVEAGAFDLSRGAQMAGLDMKQFNTCRNDQRYLPASREMVSVDNMGVNATPTFFVNGQKVEGNKPDEIRRMIDEALTSQ